MNNRFKLPFLIVCVAVVASAFNSAAFAQMPFRVDVLDSVASLRGPTFVDLNANITNLSQDTIEVRAVRFLNDVPDQWFTTMCFGDQCYLPSVDVTPPALILPGKTIYFKLTAGTQDTIYGVARIRTGIRFDTGEFTEGVVHEFVVNADGTSSSPVDNVVTVGNAWPNPARTSLVVPIDDIDGSVRVQLINAMGEVVIDDRDVSVSTDGVRLDVSNLPNGAYTYRVHNGRAPRTGRFVVAH